MPMNVLFMDGDTTAIFKLSETHQIVFVFTKQFLIFFKKNNLILIVQTLIKIQNVASESTESLGTFNFATAHSPWLNLLLDSNLFQNHS